MGASRVSEVVDNLHDLIESKQVGADVAIVSLVSAAGEVAMSRIVAQQEFKVAYLKVFNSVVEKDLVCKHESHTERHIRRQSIFYYVQPQQEDISNDTGDSDV